MKERFTSTLDRSGVVKTSPCFCTAPGPRCSRRTVLAGASGAVGRVYVFANGLRWRLVDSHREDGVYRVDPPFNTTPLAAF